MAKVIGIDLGTTNSCLAISENGQTKVIEKCRRCTHHSFRYRLSGRRRSPRWRTRQTPSRNQR